MVKRGRGAAREVTVLDLVSKLRRYSFQILCLGCLALFVAGAAPAQEQAPKGKDVPPAAPGQPVEIPTMAPSPAPEEFKAKEEQSRLRQEETLQKKKVTGKVGGQEIRAKEGEETN